MRVLCIEDEQIAAELVKEGLGSLGFVIDNATDAEEAEAALAAVSYDAIILDLGLPGRVDGLTFLKRLRATKSVLPVLILSRRGSEVQSRTAGLNAGADDFLAKPFDLDELAARLRALLRRPAALMGPQLVCGNVVMRPDEMALEVGGQTLELPRREFGILAHLLRNVGRPIPKSSILDKLYAFGEEIASNSIEVQMHHLRKRLAAMGATIRIETQRGIGYVLMKDEGPPG